MPDSTLFVGLDIGTSGARVVVINQAGIIQSSGQCAMAEIGSNHRQPMVWLQAAQVALARTFETIETANVCSICVDGTSGTMLPIDVNGTPLTDASMYNDPCMNSDVLVSIAKHAPQESAAHGATSALARAIVFYQQTGAAKVVHQADWIAGQLCGIYKSDDNNALKTGYDPVSQRWPDWLEKTGIESTHLPEIHQPGTAFCEVSKDFSNTFHLPKNTLMVSGTTDGCASFLATGAEKIGDGVTVLGTTLTIKILSKEPIFSPEYGIYSHKILGKWLAGGASNSGGNVLLAHFDTQRITELSSQIDPETNSQLDYYPLSKSGERFPIADANLPARITPRPASDVAFLHGLLQGMSAIEVLAYNRLTELGRTPLQTVRSLGGGAENSVWSRIRERALDVPMLMPVSNEAAYGSAILARAGVMNLL